MRIYIAGPMTGLPLHNWPAFDRAAAQLRQRGHEPVSPADLDRARGYTPTVDGTIDRKTYVSFLKDDIAHLLTCDAVFLLPGWRGSNGARVEHHTATALDLPCYHAFYEVPILL